MPEFFVYNLQLKAVASGPWPTEKKSRHWALTQRGEFDSNPRTFLVVDSSGSQVGTPVENFAARFQRRLHANHLEVSA